LTARRASFECRSYSIFYI